ncbi:MAG: GntR family transcriptional regulator [Chloroflexi bacterium]|nr:MAG: GntR family transcriptional regulator [Chloroflexota bacterium]MBL1193814.1 GntR family transcriptional regulator [Chloroflexota bacterium]NOH11107.1 GntR family transcriptional regulator [Chloroflexota bacterium]
MTNLINPTDIDRDTPVPLYYQIAQILRKKIGEGDLTQGDQIPTEKDFQDHLNVSRSTVRKAISELVYEGLLVRRRSKGTIVANPPIQEPLVGFGSFSAEMRERGFTPKSKLLECQTIPASANVQEMLDLDEGESVLFLTRLRTVDDELVAVEDLYAPSKYVPGFNRSDMVEEGEQQSFYYILKEKFGISLYRAFDTISPAILNSEAAAVLQLEEGSPALLRTRISYDEQDNPVMYSSGLYLITLTIDLQKQTKFPESQRRT